MPLSRGLYVVKRYSPEKGVYHSAIADSGNLLGLLRPRQRFDHPYAVVIVELVSSGPQYQVLLDGLGDEWGEVNPITDQADAIARFRWVQEHASQLPYDPFLNNCEHFATFIATGRPKSPQVQAAVGWAGVFAFAALALSED